MTATIRDIIKGNLDIHTEKSAIRAAKQIIYIRTIPNRDPKVIERLVRRNYKSALKDRKDILKCRKLRETLRLF